MDYAKLGMRVRQQRVLNRLTQEQLAEKTGVSSSFIGHIERGESQLDFDQANQDLMNSLMHVLREHSQKTEY